ncbi:MAG TPA: hypothetical protein VJ486_14085 [Geothrix sp.]|nr:hypothetical protein [Geothrix sp.]
MKSLTDLPVVTLDWRTSGAPAPGFELHSNLGVVATLTFLDEAQDLARIETAEGTWTFKHAGLLNALVTIREEGSHADLAVFHPSSLGHGKLEFADGARFDWVGLPGNTAGTESGGAFVDHEGMPYLRIHAHSTRTEKTPTLPYYGEVELGTPPKARWRHGLLAAFGWYLLVTEHLMGRQAIAAETCLRL